MALPSLTRSIRDQLKLSFPAGANFYLYRGAPILLVPSRHEAEAWNEDPPRPIVPNGVAKAGLRISEERFRELVRAMHRIRS